MTLLHSFSNKLPAEVNSSLSLLHMNNWNPEDLGRVYASQFVSGQENIDQMDTPAAVAQAILGQFLMMDLMLKQFII